MKRKAKGDRRATILVMIVGLLATLFLIVTAYITLARFDKLTLESYEKSQTIDDVVGNVNAVILSTMRQSWADADGNLLAGGRSDLSKTTASDVVETYSPDDTRSGGSRWQSGLEPTRDKSVTTVPNPPGFTQYGELYAYRQPVSDFQFGRSGSAKRYVKDLLLENANDGNDTVFGLVAGDNDLLRNVRQPSMDAAGTGVPDSDFVSTAYLTELANAVADVAVRAPVGDLSSTGTEFEPSAIGNPASDALAAQWQRFDEQARYEVAVRIINNGGMVALTSPGDYTGSGSVWNREFVAGMFNWIMHRSDLSLGKRLYVTDDELLNDLWASAEEVEPLLRHRGGLLSNYAEDQLEAVPAVLRELRDRFKWTMRVQYVNSGGKPFRSDDSQRFNLASIDVSQNLDDEWGAYRDGTVLDPDLFNQAWGSATDAAKSYQRRHLITAISNSDDLAREVDPNAPNPLLDVPGVYPGQLKFYLGDIARAFDANGYFVAGDMTTNRRGHYIIRRLADYYYEMLSDYDGWQAVDYIPDDPSTMSEKSEAVSQHHQAYMLAVNTVAFAAPRTQGPVSGNNCFIDAVWYREPDGTIYVGYSPQPFISEVVAHCDEQGDIALGIELYYPHDPDDPVYGANPANKFDPADRFALDLSQFALRVNDGPAVALSSAPELVGKRLTGRNFLTLSIGHGANQSLILAGAGVWCDGQLPYSEPIMTISRDVDDPPDGVNDRVIDIELLRLGSDGQPRLIDRLTVGEDPDSDDQIPPRLSDDTGEQYCWMADCYRDMRDEPFFGGNWSGTLRPARWRMVTDLHEGETRKKDPNADPPEDCADLPADTWASYLGVWNSPLPLTPAPTTPMYTMNAGVFAAGDLPVHGAYRPRSFPTVGFMLFVPRFSHVLDGHGSRPMSYTLRKQWEQAATSTDRPNYTAGTGTYPADFGHMWIFDNHQETRKDVSGTKDISYFADKRAGKIPWGLLVFDYFTTLDPDADYNSDGRPDVDPRRIPGRININAAPWYVLAGLPIVDPMREINQSASPAFWNTSSGVMVGNVNVGLAVPLPRFDTSLLAWDLYAGGGAGWWRLGPYLAQAAASYRDRIRYASDGTGFGVARTPFWRPEVRNDNTNPAWIQQAQYRRESTSGTFNGYNYGNIRHGSTSVVTNPLKYGFLSLGELANVYGFDSPLLDLNDPANPNAILYRPLGPSSAQAYQNEPDFFKAVSLMALLDTHFLTTRSNTFTVYVSVMDRENPQASIRSQLTVDRSNLLPKLALLANGEPIYQNVGTVAVPKYEPVINRNDGLPEILTERRIGYFNTQFDY